MKMAAIHHVGLVVKDIERTGRFYQEAFNAEWRMKAVTIGPPGAGSVFGGPDDLVFEVALLQLSGVMLELFTFNGEATPDWLDRKEVMVPHLAVGTDDVPACLKRVENAGGSRIWPEMQQFGRSQMIFVRDPDGNAIELLESSVDEFVEYLLSAFPEAAPTSDEQEPSPAPARPPHDRR